MSAPESRTTDPEIFRYTNYRDYLRDYYQHQKATKKGFSYRVFSRRAEVGAPNHLQRTIDGSRNLSPELAWKFAKACELTGDAAKYFVLLVAFNQTTEPNTRQKIYKKIAKMRRFRETQHLATNYGAYYSKWYIPAVRELVTRADFREDPVWIAHQMIPPINRVQASKALAILLETGLLVRDAQGKLKQASLWVSTGDEVVSFQVAQYHRDMMRLASDSIANIPRELRDISTLTLGLDSQGLEKLKARLQAFRKELLEIASDDNPVSQIVQVNFQLFPLSHPGKDDAK